MKLPERKKKLSALHENRKVGFNYGQRVYEREWKSERLTRRKEI